MTSKAELKTAYYLQCDCSIMVYKISPLIIFHIKMNVPAV
jgi:hypothetical protein